MEIRPVCHGFRVNRRTKPSSVVYIRNPHVMKQCVYEGIFLLVRFGREIVQKPLFIRVNRSRMASRGTPHSDIIIQATTARNIKCLVPKEPACRQDARF